MKKITFLFLATYTSSLIVSAQAPKKVLLEDYTYPNCGYCPKGMTEMANVLSAYPNSAIGIANHESGPMNNSYSRAINMAYISGYPSGTIDRYPFSGNVSVSITQWMSKVANRLAVSTPLDVQISSTYSSSTRVVTVTVTTNFVAAASGDMRINCVLVEDSVSGSTADGYGQKNYMGNGCTSPDPTSPWYTYPCVINNFKHRHVSRANLSAPVGASQSAVEQWGTAGIIPATVSAGGTYSKTYSYTLPSTWKESRISIVAFVSYYDTDPLQRSVINANEVKLGSSTSTTTEVNENSNGNQIGATQNTPNPFSDLTAIQFQLNTTDNVTIKVYDMYGKEINILVDAKLVSGEHTFYWAGDDTNGNIVAGGVYFYTISTSGQQVTKSLVFMGQ